jgi:hypothetical protein
LKTGHAQHKTAQTQSPIGLPRARDLSRVDWWVKVSGPQQVRWALIEWGNEPNAVRVFLIDVQSGVFERWDEPSAVQAKARLFKVGFERLQSKRALAGHVKPPGGPFHFTKQPVDAAAPAVVQRVSLHAAPEPHLPELLRDAKAGKDPVPNRAEVEITGKPRSRLDGSDKGSRKLRRLRTAEGSGVQCPGRSKTDEHEVTIGLDFGTSATKVVIGDSSLSKSFAVPFCAAGGVAIYLLPTRVHECEKSTLLSGRQQFFSLDQGAVVHRDLKLGWLANPDSQEHRERVVAFLALVLKHARGWLFHQHESVFKPVNIAWRVAVGLPAASALNNRLADELKKLVFQAWAVSCVKGETDRDTIRRAAVDPRVFEADVQVDVVPEIAAQIFGFVTSHSFDKKAPNRYLLVDIGAGTVDSSLFRVKPGRGRKWEFEFYTAVVQPHGASNLHVHRINWWQAVLSGVPEAQGLIDDLDRNKFATDFEDSLPEVFGDYVDGIHVVKPGEVSSDPDSEFLTKRVVKQVRGETVFRTWKDQLLSQADLAGIPMFLCGGGSRMSLYQRIESHLTPQSGFSWLHAERWTLGFPDDLECEDPIDEDYDRLSVAYGLSRLDVGRVVQAAPMPKIATPAQDPWTTRYVDKDQM